MQQLRVDKIERGAPGLVVGAEARRRLVLHSQSVLEARPATFANLGRPDLSLAAAKGGDRERQAKQPSNAEESVQILGPDGSVVTLPAADSSVRVRLERIRGQTPEPHRSALERGLVRLGDAVFTDVAVHRGALAEPSATVVDEGGRTFQSYMFANGAMSREETRENAAILGVGAVERSLYGFFDKLRQEQQLEQEVRTDIAELEAALAGWQGATEVFNYHEVVRQPDGTATLVEHRDVSLTKEQAQALLSQLQGEETGLGQVQQRDFMMLQQMVNNYQQAMTVASNVLKQHAETHKTLIANVRA